MRLQPLFRVSLMLSAAAILLITANVEFTNINCRAFDPTFCNFQLCILKSVNRTYKYLSVHVNLFKLPINNITTTWAVLKRANGYKPFLYNFTVNVCEYLKKRARHPLARFFHSIFLNETNMNHSCPYNHDLIVKDLSTRKVNRIFTETLPMPEGQYAIFSTWSTDNKPRADFKIYFQIT